MSEADSPRSLIIMVVCLTLLLGLSGAFWAGRMVEQRSQLGRLLALAPALDDLTAATRSADSLSMRFMLQLGRLRPKP